LKKIIRWSIGFEKLKELMYEKATEIDRLAINASFLWD